MAIERSARPLAQSVRCQRRTTLPIRSFSKSASAREQVEPQQEIQQQPTDPPPSTPAPSSKKSNDNPRLWSKRKIAAVRTSSNIPFVELPYQCFQEARKLLNEDRKQKLEEIRIQRQRIDKLNEKLKFAESEEKSKNEHSLRSMRHHLEELKILADINDPVIKRIFEDGNGDMNKPIYRHLADKKWRSYRRKILMQRIEQMNVTPDVLAKIDPTVETKLFFQDHGNEKKLRRVLHGERVESRLSEKAPVLHIQPYQKGYKLYTIAVINPDVPDVASDAFERRCHFLACNIPIGPTGKLLHLRNLSKEKVVIPWLPAYSQKGLPYQRMSVWVLEQDPKEPDSASSATVPASAEVDVTKVKARDGFAKRENHNFKGLVAYAKLQPVGVDLFRTVWDEGTAGVMRRAGIPGWDVEFLPKRIDPLPYKRLKEERYR